MKRRRTLALVISATCFLAVGASGQLYWDGDTTTPGAQAGDGAWNTSDLRWWNGSYNTAWSNAVPTDAAFVGRYSTVTLNSIAARDLSVVDGSVTLLGDQLQLRNLLLDNSSLSIDAGTTLLAGYDGGVAGAGVVRFDLVSYLGLRGSATASAQLSLGAGGTILVSRSGSGSGVGNSGSTHLGRLTSAGQLEFNIEDGIEATDFSVDARVEAASILKSGTGTMRLDGGVTADSLTVRAGVVEFNAPDLLAPATVTLDGGALRPLSSMTVLRQDFITVGAAGGTIDTPYGVVFTYDGKIGGALANTLTKSGAGEMAWTFRNNLLGPVVVKEGLLRMTGAEGGADQAASFTVLPNASLWYDNSQGKHNNSNRIHDDAPIRMAGGRFVVQAGGANSVYEYVGALTVVSGGSSIEVPNSANTLSFYFKPIVRSAGATLDFVDTIAAGDPDNLGANVKLIVRNAPPSGFFGAWATVNARDFAVYTAGSFDTMIVGGDVANQYATTWTSDRHVKLSAAPAGPVASTTLRTLNIAAPMTIAQQAGSTLTLSAGGLIAGEQASLTGGSVASSSELVICNAADLTMDSNLSAAAGLAKTGPGTLYLRGANALGPIWINGGVVDAASASSLAGSTSALTITNGTLQASGTLSTSRPLTISGVGTVAADSTQTLTFTSGASGDDLRVRGSGQTVIQNAPGGVSNLRSINVRDSNLRLSGGEWRVAQDVYLEYANSTSLLIDGGARVYSDRGRIKGWYNTVATVSGAGTLWETNTMDVSSPPPGTGSRLEIRGGAQVISQSTTIAVDEHGDSDVVVTGPGSLFDHGHLVLGNLDSIGSLTISDQAVARGTTAYLAQYNASGHALVTGGASWELSGGLFYCLHPISLGSLSIENGGRARAAFAEMGHGDMEYSLTTVTGINSRYDIVGDVRVGSARVGDYTHTPNSIRVLDNGVASIGGTLTVNGNGELIVTGGTATASRLMVDRGDIAVAGSAAGAGAVSAGSIEILSPRSLTVGPRGALVSGAGGVVLRTELLPYEPPTTPRVTDIVLTGEAGSIGRFGLGGPLSYYGSGGTVNFKPASVAVRPYTFFDLMGGNRSFDIGPGNTINIETPIGNGSISRYGPGALNLRPSTVLTSLNAAQGATSIWGDALSVGSVTVGNFGSASLSIGNLNSAASVGSLTLGAGAGSDGSCAVALITLNMAPGGAIVVGREGRGNLLISSFARFHAAGPLTVADQPGSQGTLEWYETDGRLDGVTELRVGNQGAGTLNLWGEGHLGVTGSAYLAYQPGSTATGRVVNADFAIGGDLVIGRAGSAVVEMYYTGNTSVGGMLSIADQPGSTGRLDYDSYAMLNVGGTLHVGRGGTGTFDFNAGSMTILSAAEVSVGTLGSGVGSALVSGDGAQLRIGNSLVVGNAGVGTMALDYYSVTTARSVAVGAGAGSTGELTVRNNARLEVADSITVGGPGAGTLRIETGGQVVRVATGAGALLVNAGGLVEVDGGTLSVGTGGLSMQAGAGGLATPTITLTGQASHPARLELDGDVVVGGTFGNIGGNEFSAVDLGGANRVFTVAGSLGLFAPVTNGGVIKRGGGHMYMTNSQYSGPTTVEAGTLHGLIPSTSHLTVLAGATFDTGPQLLTSFAVAGRIQTSDTVTLNPAAATDFSGNLEGTASRSSVHKTGAADLTLRGNSSGITLLVSGGSLFVRGGQHDLKYLGDNSNVVIEAPAVVNSSGGISVGAPSTPATLRVSSGGILSSAATVSVGDPHEPSEGTLEVLGAGSLMTVAGDLIMYQGPVRVGDGGELRVTGKGRNIYPSAVPSIHIFNGGKARFGELVWNHGGEAALVEGANSLLQADSLVAYGFMSSSRSLRIINGAALLAGSVGIGTAEDAGGKLYVSGAGSTFNYTSLFVGSGSGSGRVEITDGATASGGSTVLGGLYGGGYGVVRAASWSISGELSVGSQNSSDGSLNIESGGVVSCASAQIGGGFYWGGSVTLTGAGSRLDCAGDALIGRSDIYFGDEAPDRLYALSSGSAVIGGKLTLHESAAAKVSGGSIQTSSALVARGLVEAEAGQFAVTGLLENEGGLLKVLPGGVISAGGLRMAVSTHTVPELVRQPRITLHGQPGAAALFGLSGDLAVAASTAASILPSDAVARASSTMAIDGERTFNIAAGSSLTIDVPIVTGSITKSGEGMLMVQSNTVLSGFALAEGPATISGGTWNVLGPVRVLSVYTPPVQQRLIVNGGARITSGAGMVLGQDSLMRLEGTGTLWEAGDLIVHAPILSYSTPARLEVLAGARLASGETSIGTGEHNQNGVMLVSGPGTTWNHGPLTVGDGEGNGTLTISAGAVVEGSFAHVGIHGANVGMVTVTGPGSSWRLLGAIELRSHDSSRGELHVADGALVRSASGWVDTTTFSAPTDIRGTGSRWDIDQNLTVGRYSEYSYWRSEVEVAQGGAMTVGGLLSVGLTGLVDVDSGSLQAASAYLDRGTIRVQTASASIGSIESIGGTISIQPAGNISVGAGGLRLGNLSATSEQPHVLMAGIAGSAARLTLGGNLTVAGPTTAAAIVPVTPANRAYSSLDLGGAVRTFNVAGDSSLSIDVPVVNGSIVKTGLGALAMSADASLGSMSLRDGFTTLSNGQFNLTGALAVTAFNESPQLRIDNGARVISTGGLVDGMDSIVTLNGAGTLWQSPNLNISALLYTHSCQVEVRNGARLASGDTDIGTTMTTGGGLLVTGAGSSWQHGVAVIGSGDGSGSVALSDGASASGITAYISRYNGIGYVDVNTGASWSLTGGLYFGKHYQANGTLQIESGGRVTCGFAEIGQGIFQTGDVDASGAGSRFDVTGAARVGIPFDEHNNQTPDSLSIRSGATSTIGGTLTVNETGVLQVTGGSLQAGTLAVIRSDISVSDGLISAGGITLTAPRSVNIGPGGTLAAGSAGLSPTTGLDIVLSGEAGKPATLLLGGDLTYRHSTPGTLNIKPGTPAAKLFTMLDLGGGTRFVELEDGPLNISVPISNGSLRKLGGGELTLSADSTLAEMWSIEGLTTVTGATVQVNGQLRCVPLSGGNLKVHNGGRVIAQSVTLGNSTIIEGTGSLLETQGLYIGDNYGMTAIVRDGARLVSGSTGIGINDSFALLTVTGPATLWSHGSMTVGSSGESAGRLRILDGATVSGTEVTLGGLNGGGHAEVIQSHWLLLGMLRLGSDFGLSSGQLDIDRGQVTCGSAEIGGDAGEIEVHGASALFEVMSSMIVGVTGTILDSQRLSVHDGGVANIAGPLTVRKTGIVSVGGGQLTAGQLNLESGAFSVENGTCWTTGMSVVGSTPEARVGGSLYVDIAGLSMRSDADGVQPGLRLGGVPGGPAMLRLRGDVIVPAASTHAMILPAAQADRIHSWLDLGGGEPRVFDIAAQSSLTVDVPLRNGGIAKQGAGLLVLRGTHDLAGPVEVNAGTLRVAGSVAGSSGVTVNNSGVFEAAGTQSLKALKLNQGGTAVVSGTGAVLRTEALQFAGEANAWTAKLDLRDNDMVVQDGDLPTVLNQARQGRNNGLWNAPAGLTTSLGDSLRGLAVIRNGDNGATPLMATFGGVVVDVDSILVKFTYNGDSDLNGRIDIDDYFQIDAGYALGVEGAGATYRRGDFNYDSRVTADDYFLIDASFVGQGAGLAVAAPAASVPEPCIPPGLLLGLCLLRRGRRRVRR